MANLALSINGRDYSPFLRLFDVESQVLGEGVQYDPQFAGTLALSEGQVAIGEAVGNRHWQLQIIVKSGTPPTVDAAHALIQSMRADLFRGAQVAFTPEGASNCSYFDLEAGELRPEFHHALHRKGLVKCTLELWTRPYATTGTTRLVASQTGTGVLEFPATGVLGDVDALANVQFRLGSSAATSLVVAYGISRSASYLSAIPAASLTFNTPATLIGASGCIASQYRGFMVGTTAGGEADGAITYYLTPPEAYVGRNRVFLIVRNTYVPATWVSFSLVDAFGLNRSATVMATQAGTAPFQILDFGDFVCPNVPSGQGPVPTMRLYFDIWQSASGAPSSVASPNLGIQGVVLLPLDTAAGLSLPNANKLTDPAAREYVNIDSHPAPRALRFTSASVMTSPLNAQTRGAQPRLPAIGSPAASGPARIIAFQGDYANFLGNGILDASVSVRERFSFFR